MTPERWNLLEQLFAEALDLPSAAERERFVRESANRGADAELREELLRMLRFAGERDAPGVGGLIEDIKLQAALDPRRDWSGRRIGSYRVIREVGRGGMGIVYEAMRDDETFEKRVAIKVATALTLTGGASLRLLEERRILATLEHPGICRILDAGSEGSVPYFVMEYVEGTSLNEHCRTLGLRERLRLFLRICEAVQYAHERLVIHRDLKPNNILVDKQGNPRLLDFGTATALGLAPESGARQLTPDYASPEQVAGQNVSTRTDVYALGLLLFELLTGARARKTSSSSREALEAFLREAPPPAPSQGVANNPGTLPYGPEPLRGDLDAIVAKAAANDPAARYSSAAELAQDVQAYLETRPVEARNGGGWYRTARYLRRNWGWVGAAAVTAASLIGGAAGFAYQARIAERRFEAVRQLATTYLFDLHDRASQIPGSTSLRASIAETAAAELEALSKEAGRNWGLRRDLAAAYLRLGSVQGATGAAQMRADRARESYDRGLEQLALLPAAERAGIELVEARLHTGRARQGFDTPALAQASALFERHCRASRAGSCVEWADSLVLTSTLAVRAGDHARARQRLADLERSILFLAQPEIRDTVRVRLLHLGTKLLYIQKNWPECRRKTAEWTVELDRALARHPEYPTLLRVAAHAAIVPCDIAENGTEEDRRLTVRRARLAVSAGETLVRLDPGDRRAQFLRWHAVAMLGSWLHDFRLPDSVRYLAAGLAGMKAAVGTENNFDIDSYALILDTTRAYIQALLRQGRGWDPALAEARTTLGLRAIPGSSPDVLELQALQFAAESSVPELPDRGRQYWERLAELARKVAPAAPDASRSALQAYETWRKGTVQLPAPEH